MKTFCYKCVDGITLGATNLLKHADKTLQHKPLSTTEGQRVALMNLGAIIEIRGDTINSGHRWPEKRKQSTWAGTSKKNCPCDLMMGCASGTFRKLRGPPSSGIV